MRTDPDGKLCLYLPNGTSTTAAKTTDGAAPPTMETYAGAPVVTNASVTANNAADPFALKAFAVTGGPAKYTYGADSVLTFTQSGNYTAAMAAPGTTTTTDRIVISSGVTANIMLSGVARAAGKKAEITVGAGDKSGLYDEGKAAVGDRPLIELSLYIDGEQTDWSNPDAPVTVSIPYTPKDGEDPNAIVIWYIGGDGNFNCIPNGRYNAATGTVSFEVTHFSRTRRAITRLLSAT